MINGRTLYQDFRIPQIKFRHFNNYLKRKGVMTLDYHFYGKKRRIKYKFDNGQFNRPLYIDLALVGKKLSKEEMKFVNYLVAEQLKHKFVTYYALTYLPLEVEIF